jgi:hypothetical protein
MRLIYILLVCLSFLSPLHAQIGTQSSLTGTVDDMSGAVIPGAEISVVNLATLQSITATSDDHGSFNVLALKPGNYKITVSAQGFSAWIMPSLTLSVGERSRIAPTLKVGSSTEVVNVAGSTGLLQTDNSTVETVIQMQQIRELPLDTRNPLGLVSLVPGMIYQGTTVGSFRDSFVQGNGLSNNRTNFQLDGLTSNTSSSEGGTAIPNVDAIQEFSVQSVNSGAEQGRDPTQVLAITKAGTNEFHGTLFEFNQNDLFSARNAFALKKNRIRYNQFGGTLGGPIVRNKTFFFGSYQQTVIGNDVVFNQYVVTPEMKAGDFSALSTPIINPYTHTPFSGNIIPQSMINNASKYFLDYFTTPNSPGQYFKALAKAPNITHEYVGRIDHQITPAQHIFARFAYIREPITVIGYRPSVQSSNTTTEPSLGGSYTWTISPKTLLTLTGGFMRDAFTYNNPALGKQNDSELAGIQGIPSAGREAWIGPPAVGVSGYQAFSFGGGGYGGPGSQSGGMYNGKAAISRVSGSHLLEAGGEYLNRTAYGNHGSAAPNGSFGFYNLYTGNGFADYLLGLVSTTTLNDPLGQFGETFDPMMAVYGKDTWKATSNITFNIGLRYERYLEHAYANNIASIWNERDGKTVVATDSHDKPNFSRYSTTPYLAAVSAGLWETAGEAGYPHGLYRANGTWEPRLGVVYRPFRNADIIVRGGYGLYTNTFTGNAGASQINVPLWSLYSQSFSKTSLNNWQDVWASGPQGVGPFGVTSSSVDVKPARTREWNISIQSGLPFKSALTISYVGTSVHEPSGRQYNAPSVGFHSNLQNDRPHPHFGSIYVLVNEGKYWYNGLQTKWERRYENGLSFTASYAWSKTMTEGLPGIPYSPAWYNRNVTGYGYPHVESATILWQIPFGHSKKFGANSGRIVNQILGGWQISGIQTAHSGGALEIGQSNGNLGNGYSSRTNLIGNPRISNPSKDKWFNTSAFAAPDLYTWGNSGVGSVVGPGAFQVNSGLSKSFYWAQDRYLQFRWETFNLTNRVNYCNPDTNFQDGSFGQIGCSATARYMQFGLKAVF